MTERLAAEALSQYLDDLNAGKDNLEAFLALCAEHRGELFPLLAFARYLKRLFVPVTPSEEFARNLRSRLVAAPVAPTHQPIVFSRERLLVGAAALGSVAAIMFVLLRGRALGARAA